ncbi:DUF2845 domain-containing protein [Methylocystis parvus]|uniref:DUF2845 domain-containing protein n=1 Tax=Methylocystis parvus TaxID=134 RepID=UPI003C711CCA
MKYRVLLGLLICAASAGPAFALRCGTSLVIEGQSKFDVLQRCGEPAYTDSHVEYRSGMSNPLEPRPLDSLEPGFPYPAVREVTVEEWVYNFGPTQLMSSLVFENGRLLKIRTLGYGR